MTPGDLARLADIRLRWGLGPRAGGLASLRIMDDPYGDVAWLVERVADTREQGELFGEVGR